MVGLLSDYPQPFIQAFVYMSVYVEFLAVQLRALLSLSCKWSLVLGKAPLVISHAVLLPDGWAEWIDLLGSTGGSKG